MKNALLRSLILSLILLLGVGLFAQDLPEELQRLDDSDATRFGLEVEVIEPSLEHMVHLFDFTPAFGTVIPDMYKSAVGEDALDDYLKLNAELFWELPKSLQDKLSEGLEINRTLLHRAVGLDDLNNSLQVGEQRKLILTTPTILSPNQQPISLPQTLQQQSSEVINDDRGLILSDQQKHDQNWAIINQRWNELSWDEKLHSANWNKVGRNVRARILFYLAGSHSFPLSKDAPDDFNDLMKNIGLKKDGPSVEFTYNTDYELRSVVKYYEDMMTLAKYLGPQAQLKLKDPQDIRVNGYHFGSYHVHISYPARIGPDVKLLALELNSWLRLKRINLGIISDLETGNRYTYSNDITVRGLIRVIDKAHFELRVNDIPLDELLTFVVPLTTMDTEDAIEVVSEDIKRMLTDENLLRIGQYKPDMIRDLTDYISESEENELSEVMQQLLIDEDEARQLTYNSHEMFLQEKYQQWVMNNHWSAREIFLDSIMKVSDSQLEDYRPFFNQILQSTDAALINALLSRLDFKEFKVRKTYFHHVPSLMQNLKTRGSAIRFLRESKSFSPEIWNIFIDFLSQSEAGLSSMLFRLDEIPPKDAPKEFWEALGYFVFSDGFVDVVTEATQLSLYKFLYKRNIPKVFGDHIKRNLNHPNQIISFRAKLILSNSSLAMRMYVHGSAFCDELFKPRAQAE